MSKSLNSVENSSRLILQAPQTDNLVKLKSVTADKCDAYA